MDLGFFRPRLPVSAYAAAGGGFYFSSRFMIARNTFKQMLAVKRSDKVVFYKYTLKLT